MQTTKCIVKCDAQGMTNYAIDFLKQHFDLTKICRVEIYRYSSLIVPVKLFFIDGVELEIESGFSTGFIGEASNGLHRILMCAGFSKKEADTVYEKQSEYIFKKKMIY